MATTADRPPDRPRREPMLRPCHASAGSQVDVPPIWTHHNQCRRLSDTWRTAWSRCPGPVACQGENQQAWSPLRSAGSYLCSLRRHHHWHPESGGTAPPERHRSIGVHWCSCTHMGGTSVPPVLEGSHVHPAAQHGRRSHSAPCPISSDAGGTHIPGLCCCGRLAFVSPCCRTRGRCHHPCHRCWSPVITFSGHHHSVSATVHGIPCSWYQ